MGFLLLNPGEEGLPLYKGKLLSIPLMGFLLLNHGIRLDAVTISLPSFNSPNGISPFESGSSSYEGVRQG